MRERGMAHSVSFANGACYECGICAAACPREAIRHGSLSKEQLHAATCVAAAPLLGRAPVVVLACRQGAVQAADGAGRLGLELPAEAVIVDVPCAGRVSEGVILEALIAGAAGVVVLGCHPHNCRSLHGSDAAHHRSDRVRSSIEALGMAAERVQFHGVAANEPERLAHVLAAAVTEINEASKE
jgi:coenzyme F420-reducing hydrogenase delta subunit